MRSMLTCREIRPAATWGASQAADTVVLDFDGRHRRRMLLTGQAGLEFLLDLARTTALRDGDGLLLSDGRIVRVAAAPERLLEIAAPDLDTLVRIAWHLGNRHLPTQVWGERLYIRHDHVILDMVRGLRASVTEVQAAFDPEGGAFSAEATHHHHHGPDEADHAHGEGQMSSHESEHGRQGAV